LRFEIGRRVAGKRLRGGEDWVGLRDERAER
jgi:hypothetical protein